MTVLSEPRAGVEPNRPDANTGAPAPSIGDRLTQHEWWGLVWFAIGAVLGARSLRDNSFLTHQPNGTFCYGFYPHGSHPAGNGSEYRATIQGPGVTPDIMWQGPAPGPYNATASQAAQQDQKLDFADTQCKPV